RAEQVHLLRGVVADADRADAALPVERVQRLRRLLDRHERIGPVDLIEIDVVGAEALQGVADLLPDARARRVPRHPTVPPLEPHLGGQYDAVSPSPTRHRLADDLLGAALAVGGRRVDQRDAALERRTDGADRALLVGPAPHPAAHRPGAEPDAG